MAGQNEKSRFSTVLIPLIVIPAVFLGLISFFGYLDSTGLYSRLLNEKIAVTGRSSADMINNSLASAQDLAGYNGFAAAAGRLLQEEQFVRLVKITDADNKTVYEQEQAAGERDLPFSEEFQQTRFEPDERGYTVTQNPTAFLLSFPLHNQSRVLGSLRLIVPKAAASLTAGHTYLYIWLGCGAAVLLFTLLLVLFLRGVSGGTKTGIGFIWVLLFLALAGYSGYSMYEQAGTLVHEKLESTKASLVQDIKSSFTENADAAFLRTTQNIFNRYQKADPDIAFISLTGDAGELVHTLDEENPVQAKADDTYAVLSADVPLTSADTNRTLTVNLGVNNLLVPEKLLQQYINLLILLVTSIVLSLCLLNLFWAARRGPAQTDRALTHAEFVPSLFFLIVFSEALVVWLMPSFIQKTVVSAGLNQNLVPLVFSVYFAGFWISLLPSRLVAKRTRVKGLLIIGALCAAAGYFVLAFFNEYYYVILSRGLAGIGHGMIISGLCSLSADTEKRSSYAFYAYAGGMAAGICFGSLLGSYIPLMYIFIIAGGLAGFMLLYNLLFFPASLKQNNEAREEAPAEPLPKRVLLTITDPPFVKSFFFVGMIGRIIVTGLVIFMLPLLLQGTVTPRMIGLVISVYFIGLFLSGLLFSRLIIKSPHIRFLLFVGTQLAGLALFALGFINWPHLAEFIPINPDPPVLIAGGLGILGLAHGLFSAPLPGYLRQAKSASFWEEPGLRSGYTFLEHIGSLAGPLLAAQLFLLLNDNMLAVSWIGVASIIGGVLFMLGRRRTAQTVKAPPDDKITRL